MTDTDALAQLSQQQGLFTASLRSALEGHWTGEGSVEAFLLALDPNLAPLQSVDYLLTSEAGELTLPDYLQNYDPNTYQPPQAASWTCSACSLAWLERATQVNPGADEWSAVAEIGQPENINPTYGLMDGSGAQLQRVLIDIYGVPTSHAWLSYDTAWTIYSQVPGMMSGGAWYHWSAVRGTVDGNLWLANSAPGYQSVWDVLTRDDFNRLGPFSCVWVDR